MRYRLVSPVHRKGTANAWFMKRIPADVRERMVGLSLLVPIGGEVIACKISSKTTTLRFSLRSSTPSEVKIRQAEAAAFFEALWASMRTNAPLALTHRQCVALAGRMFRNWASDRRGTTLTVQFDSWKPGAEAEVVDEPFDDPALWEGVLAHVERIADGRPSRLIPPAELEPIFGPIIDHALREEGISAVDAASRALLLSEFLNALRDAAMVQKRQADGDFSPAPELERFPAWEQPKPVGVPPSRSNAVLPLRGLVDRWWVEAKAGGRSQSTLESYRRTVNQFADFLKHGDAARVTKAEVVAFKDHRIAGGASLKTVKDSDLAALKSIFGFAVGNHLLTANPCDGIKITKAKGIKTRPKGFTDEEARAILTKSLNHKPAANENAQTSAAKRWVPWLCAYTGARVGELVQLRKQDVREEGGLWIVTITPEAGTVKDKEMREVVLHAHLVEQGFPAFIRAAKTPYVFLTAKLGEDIRGKWRATKNRLADFAREVVPDIRVKPNHGWRHGFQTRGHEAGIEDSVLDAIGGWAPASIARRYGDVTLEAQAAAFRKFPRFDVG